MFKVSEEVLQKVLQYLASQPYANVFQLINEIQKCEKVKEETIE